MSDAYWSMHSPVGQTSLTVQDGVERILSEKMSVSCDFKDNKGVLTHALIKNGQVKAQLPVGDPTDVTTVVYSEGVGYLWNKKTAIKFTVTPEVLKKAGKSQGIDFLDQIENYKKYCKDAKISDSEFDLPKNTSFKDYSAFVQFMK